MPLSEEHKAKMKAGRESARQKKIALKDIPFEIPQSPPRKEQVPEMPKVFIYSGSKPTKELIESLDWHGLSYDEMSAMMPVIRDMWEKAAHIMQQKQSVLEASARKVPCSTCGALVDITKSGKFQQKTVRDPITFNPMNVYFCSQGCIQGYEAKLQRDYQKRQGVAV